MNEAREAVGERGRWSSRRKAEVVLRVLRGEDLDGLSRELGVTAGTIAQWREQFLASGQAGLKSRPADERNDELARLRAKVGELTMDNELLRERARGAEVRGGAASPSVGRRYGLVRACRVLEIPRSTVYAARARRLAPSSPRKRGPQTAGTGAQLIEQIRRV